MEKSINDEITKWPHSETPFLRIFAKENMSTGAVADVLHYFFASLPEPLFPMVWNRDVLLLQHKPTAFRVGGLHKIMHDLQVSYPLHYPTFIFMKTAFEKRASAVNPLVFTDDEKVRIMAGWFGGATQPDGLAVAMLGLLNAAVEWESGESPGLCQEETPVPAMSEEDKFAKYGIAGPAVAPAAFVGPAVVFAHRRSDLSGAERLEKYGTDGPVMLAKPANFVGDATETPVWISEGEKYSRYGVAGPVVPGAPTPMPLAVEMNIDDLPINFQVAGARDDVIEVYRRMKSIPKSIEIHPDSCPQNMSAIIRDAPLPVEISVKNAAISTRGLGIRWSFAAQCGRTTQKLRFHANLTDEDLHFLATQDCKISELEISLFGDTHLILGELSQFLLMGPQVRKIKLVLPQNGSLNESKISGESISMLLKSLCDIPSTSKLEMFEISPKVREIVTGDPFMWVSAVNECLANPTVERLLKLDPTELPNQTITISPIEEHDAVTLVLPGSGIDTFVKGQEVLFSRKRLSSSSVFLRNVLEQSPEESRIPLPLEALKQRTVSVEALTVTSKLLQHCPCGEGVKNDETEEKLRPVWTPEFEEVFEAVFLPLLEESDIPPFRRQLALKLFGEILELGRYLELRVAYEFGLVGGLAVFTKRMATEPRSESSS